jgi:hypothetical protein
METTPAHRFPAFTSTFLEALSFQEGHLAIDARDLAGQGLDEGGVKGQRGEAEGRS